MKITKEVKIGILVIAGIILFIFGFNYLKGNNLLESTNIYSTEFDYNALTKSSLVTVKGNSVGKIQDIVYDYDTGKTKVYFTVNDKLKFTKNSIIKLYAESLMGGNALEIQVSKDGELAKNKDVLKSTVEVGLVKKLSESFSGISGELNSTLQSTDTLMISLNKFVNDDSASGLKQTIQELNATLRAFKNTSNSVNGLVAKNSQNITQILEKFKTTSSDFAVLAAQLKKANIGNTVTNFNNTLTNLNKLLENIEGGKGSIGKMFKEEALYNNIEGATKELEALLKDIKLHPKRYFRILSKKEIPYQEETN